MFPTLLRGMSVGISASLNRIVSIGLPLVVQQIIGINFKIPIYLSAILYISAGIAAAFLPYETRGRDAN